MDRLARAIEGGESIQSKLATASESLQDTYSALTAKFVDLKRRSSNVHVAEAAGQKRISPTCGIILKFISTKPNTAQRRIN